MNKAERILSFQRRIAAVNKSYRFARHGVSGGRPILDVVGEELGKLAKFGDEDATNLADLEDAARNGDQPARRALHKLRVITTQNYLFASGLFMPRFANIVNLADDEQARFQRSTMQEVRISRLAPSTVPDQVNVIRDDVVSDQAFIQMYRLHSDRVTAPIYDLNRGLLDSALATVDIAADLSFKVDREIKGLLLANKGAGGFFSNFNFSEGAGVDRTLFLHSGVDAGNLPVRNYCNLVATSTILDVCLAVMQYTGSFGTGTLKGGDLMPTGTIIVPSSETTRYVAALQAAAFGSQISDLENKIQSEGYLSFGYLGVQWTLLPDVTIPKGTCYPVLNKPACYAFFKPGLDATIQPQDKYDLDKNEQSRAGAISIGAYFEESHRINALQIGYTAANSGAATSLFA